MLRLTEPRSAVAEIDLGNTPLGYGGQGLWWTGEEDEDEAGF
jgi:hypothetical protein